MRSSVVRALSAAVLGAIGVAGFAPFHLWPLLIVSLAGLFALWFRAGTKRQAAWHGFLWGLGFFLCGVSWLYVSLHVYGNMPAPMAAFAILIFCAYLSLFPLLAGMLVRRLHAQLHDFPLVIALAAIPALFVLTEYLRGWFMSGFPWLIVGYSQTPGGLFGAPLAAPLSGYAPVFGVFGVSWMLAFTAGALLVCIPRLSGLEIVRPRRIAVVAVTAVLWAGGFGMQWIGWSAPAGAPLAVALLQGNIEQEMKWREDQRAATLADYLAMVKTSKARLIVLPETALPTFIDEVPGEYLDALKQQAVQNGGDLIVGVPIAQRALPNEPQSSSQYTYYNSAISLGVSPGQRYDKQHLVAFGEFMPPTFSWVYQWLKIPLAGFTPGAREQAAMRVSGHRVAVNICYEDTFGDEIRRPLPEAELLVNVSNMAWYGRSLAADQHAQFSQMRALETSRWMLRATNTGVTAAINEHGEIVKELPQFTRGTLEIEAQPRNGLTPFVRWGDWPVLLGIALVLIATAFFARKSRP
ncbi:MAG TPA: apolipoprotein N-acyltransferase [Usitatibacteraceae bacterium]